MSDKLTTVETPDTKRSDTIDSDESIEVGQWYWVEHDEGQEGQPPWLGCVTRVGTNYAKLEGIQYDARVHFDEFDEMCKRERNPDAVIDGQIQKHQAEVNRLLGRVKEETARLGMAPRNKLEARNETQALAKLNSGITFDGYKDSLVKAKKETLPDLFEAIKDENTALASWMSAKVIPLKAQAGGLHALVEQIDNRIFSVDLYAGLSEKVEQIAEGAPADEDAKVHLMQRRCYMDEECLARYTTGGMEFKDIEAFDAWLAAPENRDRILPFPRCIVSFQVRRHEKERDTPNLRDFVKMIEDRELDEATFLYFRNGDQIFRMSTKLEFGEKLFPDMDRARLETGKIYAKMFAGRVDELISENEYLGMREDEDRKHKEWEAEMAQKKADKAAGKKVESGGPWDWEPARSSNSYEPFDKGTVYYDDIAAKTQKEIRHHNRIALILQGLIDRSPVFHPHPAWEIWTGAGFEAALELIYDDSRTLVAGAPPDFKAYRKKLNESLTAGSVTVGQEDVWQRYEAEKEGRRLDNDYRSRSDYRPTHYSPYGNSGPGMLARVVKVGKRTDKITFAWERNRQTPGRYGEKIRTTFTCGSGVLLNADAYKPGDFRQFFDDPRTRADYLRWAPMLLEAEEYHAGNRKVTDPASSGKKPQSSWESKQRYRQQKLRKQLTGKAVRLTDKIETTCGKVYEVGSLWRVMGGQGNTFSITGITADGERDKGSHHVTGVYANDFEVDESIAEREVDD